MMIQSIKCRHCGDVIKAFENCMVTECTCYEEYTTNGGHGIYIDKGLSYYTIGGNLDDIEYLEEIAVKVPKIAPYFTLT